jgi:hypothetical protein
MKYEIKNKWTGELIYSAEVDSWKQVIKIALKSGANLEGANLWSANLEGANLEGANLWSANLEGANLEGANLRSANLEGANLRSANLEGANLRSANLEGANLRSANLEGANLEGANLEGANLWSANLEGANLRSANLEGANLEGANLEGANLEGANLPSPAEVLSARWGELSDELTADLMRYDAFFHPNPEAFTKWATGGPCPFTDLKIQRAAHFTENKKLWVPGPPKNGYELMVAVLKEKAKTDL